MRICVLHNKSDKCISNNIISLISEKYNMKVIYLNPTNINDLLDKLSIQNFVSSMPIDDYIKVKQYFKETITCYVNCSDDNEKIINDNNLWDDNLFTFRILNNKILSNEQIADMIYEACYGRELMNNKNRRKIMLEKELLFAKTKSNAVIPSKREEDGCYDIYCYFDENEIRIEPHEIKLIDSGIATAFNKKWRLAIRERGSNSKSGLITMSGQVDSGYRGSIFISLYNTNDIPVIITKSVDKLEKTKEYIRVPYTKAIAQFAMEEVPVLIEKEVDYETLKKIYSERGIGSLGSSGK